MCESIRTYLMGRIADLRRKGHKWQHRIMPKPMKRLDREIEQSGNWLPIWSAEEEFQVEHVSWVNSFIVDLAKKTCSCNFWQLVGIPCRHAIAGMSYKCYDPVDYVDMCYSKEKYLECYSNGISPINGQNMWPTTSNEEVLPPVYKRGPGRPKKLRRREPDEDPNATKLKRQNTQYRCTKCDKLGHNSRGCKSSEVSEEGQKRKRKPKKVRTEQVPTDAAVGEEVVTDAGVAEQVASASSVPAASGISNSVNCASSVAGVPASKTLPASSGVAGVPASKTLPASSGVAGVPASLVQQIKIAANKKKALKDKQVMRPKLQIRRKPDGVEPSAEVDVNGTQESNTKSQVVTRKMSKYMAPKYNLRKNSGGK